VNDGDARFRHDGRVTRMSSSRAGDRESRGASQLRARDAPRCIAA